MNESHPGLAPAVAVLGGLVGGALLFGVGVLRSWDGPLPAVPAPLPVESRQDPVPGLFLAPDRFLRGDSLSDVLVRNGFSAPEIAAVAEAIGSVAEVRRLRAGQAVWVHRNRRGAPSRVELPLDDFRQVAAVRSGDRWAARELAFDPASRREVVRGVVSASLYQSLVGTGERPDLAVRIARALEYDIDFHRDTRRGDSWSVVVDKLYDREGKWKAYGNLQAVRYVNAGRPIFAFRFELPTGEFGYYDRDGNSIRRTFLMSPVEYSRISGVFTSRRFHPVHRVYRPHYGVDYAAPTGTPVMATADGVVADAGTRGPNGKMVTLRHAGGYVTKYLHLSRFADAARPGRRVRQREVIGYVGSTGVSTGPHVDYRLSRHGRPLNPRTHTLPPGPPIPAVHRAAFERWREALEAALDEAPRRAPEAVATLAGGS